MITNAQQKWLDHLPDDDQVAILPFDPTAQAKFEVVQKKIQAVLGDNIPVLHRGATSLGISGQDEIDVYVPVPTDHFDKFIKPLTVTFGNPRSHYPHERARFVTEVDGKHIDIFLVSETHQSWLDGVKFDALLRSNPEALLRYRLLKEANAGLSTREYYRRKTEFFNEILALINQESEAI